MFGPNFSGDCPNGLFFGYPSLHGHIHLALDVFIIGWFFPFWLCFGISGVSHGLESGASSPRQLMALSKHIVCISSPGKNGFVKNLTFQTEGQFYKLIVILLGREGLSIQHRVS